MIRELTLIAALTASTTGVAAAQRALDTPRPRPAQVRPGQPLRRAQLERNVRQAFYRVVRNRVGLDDGQMRQLVSVNQKYDVQRRTLLQQENQTRRELRTEMQGSQASDAKVNAGLARLQEIRLKRLEIDGAEQRDLATFLSPVQRAKYHALQEQMRRRLEQLRQQHRENQLTDDSIPG